MSIKTRLVVVVTVATSTAIALGALRALSPGGRLRAAFDAEFIARPDGYPGLRKHYGLEFEVEPVQMDPGLMYLAVAEGSIDVIDGFSTDGRIDAYDLVVLEDDRGFFPPYEAAPLVRRELIETRPEIGRALESLAGRIDDETMRRLNFSVDEFGRKASEVAREFLERHGLLRPAVARSTRGDPIAIGGKHFTEQEVLGEMMAILLENNLGIPVERRLNMGGTMICFNALMSGDIDLYPEYTGTGLVSILGTPSRDDPLEVYRTVKREFRRRHDLVWLTPFGFSNTYALVMKRERANSLGLSTIGELARHLNDPSAR